MFSTEQAIVIHRSTLVEGRLTAAHAQLQPLRQLTDAQIGQAGGIAGENPRAPRAVVVQLRRDGGHALHDAMYDAGPVQAGHRTPRRQRTRTPRRDRRRAPLEPSRPRPRRQHPARRGIGRRREGVRVGCGTRSPRPTGPDLPRSATAPTGRVRARRAGRPLQDRAHSRRGDGRVRPFAQVGHALQCAVRGRAGAKVRPVRRLPAAKWPPPRSRRCSTRSPGSTTPGSTAAT